MKNYNQQKHVGESKVDHIKFTKEARTSKLTLNSAIEVHIFQLLATSH